MVDPLITIVLTSFVTGAASKTGEYTVEAVVAASEEGWKRHDAAIDGLNQSVEEGWKRHDAATKGPELCPTD